MAKITGLFGSFESPQELISYAEAQFVALASAAEKIKALQSELSHLKTLLDDSIPKLGQGIVEQIIKTPEEGLIDMQITKLRQRGMISEFTLEEVKTLDILLKNKKLLSGEPTTINGKQKKEKKKYTANELILIASTPEVKKDE